MSHSFCICFRFLASQIIFFDFFISARVFVVYFWWKAYVQIQKIFDWIRYQFGKMIRKSGCNPMFLFRILTSIIVNLELFLSMQNISVDSFCECRALIPRKYLTEQGTRVSHWSETFKYFWLHSSFFDLEQQNQKCRALIFFTSKKSSVVTFSKTGWLTSHENVAGQGVNIQKWSKSQKLLWSHASLVV